MTKSPLNGSEATPSEEPRLARIFRNADYDITIHDRDDEEIARFTKEERAVIANALASTPQSGLGEPVAWRVKDYADGWIVFASELDARLEAKQTGALLQPLYAAPPVAPPSTKSAPALIAPHNSGERLPSSDAANVGAGTLGAMPSVEDVARVRAAIDEMTCECNSYHGFTCGRCKALSLSPIVRDLGQTKSQIEKLPAIDSSNAKSGGEA